MTQSFQSLHLLWTQLRQIGSFPTEEVSQISHHSRRFSHCVYYFLNCKHELDWNLYETVWKSLYFVILSLISQHPFEPAYWVWTIFTILRLLNGITSLAELFKQKHAGRDITGAHPKPPDFTVCMCPIFKRIKVSVGFRLIKLAIIFNSRCCRFKQFCGPIQPRWHLSRTATELQ